MDELAVASPAASILREVWWSHLDQSPPFDSLWQMKECIGQQLAIAAPHV